MFGAAAVEHAGQRGIVQILDDRRLQTITALGLVFDDDVREFACTIDLDEFGVLVDVAARQLRATGNAQRGDAARRIIGRRREHLEIDISEQILDVDQPQRIAQVRLVGAVERKSTRLDSRHQFASRILSYASKKQTTIYR